MARKVNLPVITTGPRGGRLMRIQRRYTFEAAHRLPFVPPSHKCHGLHGHSYTVELELAGRVHEQLGWVLDFGVLDVAWGAVGKPLDHRYLNELEGLQNPTAENLAAYLWDRLAVIFEPIESVELSRVTVHETERGAATLEREG